jgi:hypothetical protein
MNIAILSLIGLSVAGSAQAGSLTVRSTQGANSVEVVRSPSEKAKAFLKTVAGELNLQDDLSDLKLESVTESPVGYHIRFAQMKGELPVHQAGVVVTLSRTNQIISYQSSYLPTDSSKRAPAFSISEETAVSLAYENLALTASPASQTITQKVMVIDGVSRPVYDIKISAPVDKKWGYQVIVDADSGAIRASNNLVHDSHDAAAAPTPSAPYPFHPFVPGTPLTPVAPAPTPPSVVGGTSVAIAANVFDPNPTIKANKVYGSVTGFSDANNVDSAFFDSMLKQTSIQGTLVNGKYILAGKYVIITDQETPRNPDCTVTAATMSYNRAGKCFDDVNAFYHITNSLTYLNETLGIVAHPSVYTGAFHVDPHGLDGDDNSHYSEMTDEIAFGEGGIDDAQDHDVLLHELGHAIHSWVTKGHLSQVEGLSEGSGDYWAVSYSRSQMTPTNVAWNWSFSFDGHNEWWDGRVTNITAKYPASVKGANAEIHTAGQAWATVCLDIWTSIGKEKMDKIFWSGLAMTNENSNQLDAAKAVYAAAKQIYPTDQTLLDAVKTKFNAHGYTVQ